MIQNTSRGWGVSASGAQEPDGGSIAGKRRNSPKFGEKTLGAMVFDGKSTGSKRGPSRTHLGVIELGEVSGEAHDANCGARRPAAFRTIRGGTRTR